MGKKHEADANLIVYSAKRENYDFYNYREFTLEGFPWYKENQSFVRMPERMLSNFNENMQEICKNPAGGVLRFCTNTRKMALFCTYHHKDEHDCLSQCADAGFDLYRYKNNEYRFAGTFRPSVGEENLDMERVISEDDEMYEYMLYMPVYSWVKDFEIGIKKGSQICDAPERRNKKILLTYGSSVTQGICASRPGLSWPATVSRMCGCELINLAFSGNCHAEECIANEFAKLDFDLFVMEYGYNETDADVLRERHKPFFDIIRKSHPDTPIVIMSRPSFNYEPTQKDIDFRLVAYATYKSAIDNGDDKVYFIDGLEIFPKEMRGDCTSPDNVHPNDRGMFEITKAVYSIAKEFLAI